MNSEKNQAPENLPTDFYNTKQFDKETLERMTKFIIVFLIVIILSPMVKNNIVSTYNDIRLTKIFLNKISSEFPSTFPSLTNAGENITNFVVYETKEMKENASENLSLIINPLSNSDKEKNINEKCFYVCEVNPIH